jgi:HemY protein
MRALPAILFIAALVAISVFFAQAPGSVHVLWGHWEIDTSVAVLVPGIVVLGMLAALLFHLLRRFVGGPGAFIRQRRERRRREGYRALTQGMVAVAAGDAEEAQKLARQADVLLAEPPLTLLLSAQAAQLNGDEQAARRYFTAMLDRAETEFLGLRGLIMQSLRGGDESAALGFIERARSLRPRAHWVLSSLFELQSRAGKWAEAEATLAEGIKHKALAAPASRHHHAVLLHEKSREAETAGEAPAALAHAGRAHIRDPSFAPATLRYASLLRVGGRKRAAAKALERGWRAAPHPALAEAYGTLFADEPPLQRLKRVERLAAANPGHRESHLMLAGAALEARLWGEARRHLEAAGASSAEDTPLPTPRVCRMMAALEAAEHDNRGAASAWLARAAATSVLDPTYVCEACGNETTAWSPLCPHCRSFAGLAWRPPGGPPAPRVTAAPSLMPALPVPAPWPSAVAARGGVGGGSVGGEKG